MSKQKQKPSFDLLLSKTTYMYTLVKKRSHKSSKAFIQTYFHSHLLLPFLSWLSGEISCLSTTRVHRAADKTKGKFDCYVKVPNLTIAESEQ